MTGGDLLTRLAERTAQAVCGVLEPSCPGEVQVGEATALAAGADPLAGFAAPYAALTGSFADHAAGGNVLLLGLDAARRLAAAVTGVPAPEAGGDDGLDEASQSALVTTMDQAMAVAAAATTEVLGTEVGMSTAVLRVVRAGEAADDLCPASPQAVAVELSLFGEPARLLQFLPNSFAVRMAALDDLGIETTVRRAADAASSRPSLSGVVVRLSAELGRARMRVAQAVGLPAGAVVELDAEVDAPLDLLVNGVRFATGRLLVTEAGDWAVEVAEVLGAAAAAAPVEPEAAPAPAGLDPLASPALSPSAG